MNIDNTKTSDYQTLERDQLIRILTQREADFEIVNAEYQRIKQFLESALEYSPAAIMIAESPSGNIAYINKAVWEFRGKTDAKMTGISVVEYVGTWKEFYPDGRQYTGAEMPLARSLTTGEVVVNEEMIVRLDDGTEKWALANTAPIYDEAGVIRAGICVFSDISSIKEKEAQLLEALREAKAMNEELLKKSEELKIMNQFMLDREERIIELKEQVNALALELNREIVYPENWVE